MKNRDIIHVSEFSKEDLLDILDFSLKLKQKKHPELLKNKVLACCFFEPSTRTRLSFESAMQRLGGSVIGFDQAATTSTHKGESLSDSMKMVEHYADIVVIRHPLEGSAQLAADMIDIPVINAGDGSHQHPTQTLLDLFTIQETQGRLDELHIALAGDLKHGRTVHSLAEALIPFNPRLYFISPPSLEMPKILCDQLKEKGIRFSFHETYEEIMNRLDILYMTRIQKERFTTATPLPYILKPEHLEQAKANLKVLHPLPRVEEIDRRVDERPHAYYFQQAGNGLYTRQALLALILGQNP